MNQTNKDRPNRWLNGFARNNWSQFGEDGITEKILEMLPDANRWCVEFGAWDGVHLSNARYLITQKSYSAVMLEGDPARFQLLTANYAQFPQVTPLNRLVGWSSEDSLDRILEQTAVPKNPDLLSIDIDGNDYHTWQAITVYRPKVVIIEFNPTIPDPVEFEQPRDPRLMHGSSILSLCKLAKQKHYELIAVTFANAFFVDAQYFGLFGIRDNSIGQLREDYSAVTYMFHTHDGTVYLSGDKKLHWHGLPFNLKALQPLPKLLQKYPDDYSPAERNLFLMYKELYERLLAKDPRGAQQLTTLGELPAQWQLDAREAALWEAIRNALRSLGLS